MNSQMVAPGTSGLGGEEVGRGERVTVHAGERGREEGLEVYQGLVKVNSLQCSSAFFLDLSCVR